MTKEQEARADRRAAFDKALEVQIAKRKKLLAQAAARKTEKGQ